MVSEEQNSEVELASEVIPVPQVQPSIEGPNENETNDETNNIPQGKPRQRKKALHAAILKQMEFYFGDSNLCKDRFLGELVRKNPNVDIEVFLRFNKIRSLTTDVERIAKALKNSTLLQVSEDGKTVCRVTPIVEKQNIDECTVYVQRLPTDADHDWLWNLFSQYGPVAYVSIPKYRFNHRIKGFAFVEFETPEGAQNCLKVLRDKGCELPSHSSPTDLLSITTFNEEEKQQNNGSDKQSIKVDPLKNYEDEDEMNENNEEIDESSVKKCDKTEKHKRKRKRSVKFDGQEDSGTDQSESTKSKKKSSNDNDEELPVSDSNVDEKRAKKRKNRQSLEDMQDSVLQNDSQGCKKQKKKKLEHDSENEQNDAGSEVANNKEKSVDQLTPNTDGKQAKKRKNRQSLEEVMNPQSGNNIKQEQESQNQEKELEDGQNGAKCGMEEVGEAAECSNDDDTTEKKKKKKRKKKKNHDACEALTAEDLGLQVMSKRDWKKLRNKYLDLQKLKMKQLKQHMRNARWNQWGDRYKHENDHDENAIKKENPASKLEFTPGVIVKIELKEACVNPKEFKAELKSNSNVKYIDVKEGSNVAFVRCDSSDSATALAQKPCEEKSFKILSGDEEKLYWDKILQDRQEKIGGKVRIKQRGRQKLLKKAEKELGKHIKFEEV
ncbi:hypothetical protein QAD02_011560 [Eretmocerus hayati]|uniref:Uncharacterized protein n=1 Tax=Eretmocerus hayati TaxID=131215 RepID=A0ACC2NWW8_9HYME|nr:hypothetical protein QAD02_011560 [Eretmocerus hayati]